MIVLVEVDEEGYSVILGEHPGDGHGARTYKLIEADPT